MRCRKVRRLVPLAAGGDLRPRQAAAFRAHADACPGCRAELERFRADLAAITAEARAGDVPGWSETEWSALMGRVRSEASLGRTGACGRAGLARRPRWAAASAFGAVIGLAVLFILFKTGPGPGRKAAATGAGPVASEAKPQEVLTMTMVSPETGLQIVWFFDKNFDYEGEKE